MAESEEIEERIAAAVAGAVAAFKVAATIAIAEAVAAAGLDRRYAAMWHQHRNVQPYVFEGSASWTSCLRCGMRYPAGEHHACPDYLKYDELGRPKG